MSVTPNAEFAVLFLKHLGESAGAGNKYRRGYTAFVSANSQP